MLDVGGGKLVVTSDGNVGIGTTNPGYKLDVNGAVKATTYYGDASHLSCSGCFAIGQEVSTNAGGNRITNVASPTASSDVATKGYVDAATGGSPYIDWNQCEYKSACNTTETLSCSSGYQLVSHSCMSTGDTVGQECRLTDVNKLYLKHSGNAVCGSIKCCKYIVP